MSAGKPIEGRDVLSPAWLRERAAAVGPMPPGDVAFVPISTALCAVIAEALEIADECEACFIEGECETVGDGGFTWFVVQCTDTNLSRAARDGIQRSLEESVRYLCARGLIEPHATDSKRIRFKELPQ